MPGRHNPVTVAPLKRRVEANFRPWRASSLAPACPFRAPRQAPGWGGCGVQLQPLVDALRSAVLAHPVLHADETPVVMLKPGQGKTHRAYLWAYAPGAFEDLKAVI